MTSQSLLPTMLRGFFEDYLAAQRDVSPNTILAYRDAIKLLLGFAARRGGRQVIRLQLADLRPATVLAFLDYLETERHNCAATRNCRLIAIHRFFAYVADRDPRHADLCRRVLDIPVKKTSSSSLTYLDRDEVKALLTAPSPADRLGLRDRALLTLLYNTGARASEAACMDINDVRLQTPSQVRIFGKGRKERVCPLWQETADAVHAYLDQRDDSDQPGAPLFLNAHGKRIWGAPRPPAASPLSPPSLSARTPSGTPPPCTCFRPGRAQRHQILARPRQHHHDKPVRRDRHGYETQGDRTLPGPCPHTGG